MRREGPVLQSFSPDCPPGCRELPAVAVAAAGPEAVTVFLPAAESAAGTVTAFAAAAQAENPSGTASVDVRAFAAVFRTAAVPAALWIVPASAADPRSGYERRNAFCLASPG